MFAKQNNQKELSSNVFMAFALYRTDSIPPCATEANACLEAISSSMLFKTGNQLSIASGSNMRLA